MSLAVDTKLCRTALPLPITPACHNPLWYNKTLVESIRQVHQHLSARHPWEGKRPVAFWRGGPTDGSRKQDPFHEMRKVGTRQVPFQYATRARSVMLSLLYPSAVNSRLSKNSGVSTFTWQPQEHGRVYRLFQVQVLARSGWCWFVVPIAQPDDRQLSGASTQHIHRVERYLELAPRQASNYTCVLIESGCSCKYSR